MRQRLNRDQYQQETMASIAKSNPGRLVHQKPRAWQDLGAQQAPHSVGSQAKEEVRLLHLGQSARIGKRKYFPFPCSLISRQCLPLLTCWLTLITNLPGVGDWKRWSDSVGSELIDEVGAEQTLCKWSPIGGRGLQRHNLGD